MSLQSIINTLPTHQVTLPVSGIKVDYRPFVVKEEKILLMAAESKDDKTMYSAVKAVIESCTNGKINMMKLPTVDVEYLFLQMRSNSIGETAKPYIKCEKCETPNEVEINLKEITPSSGSPNKKIQLVDNVHVLMKYPTVGDVSEGQENSNTMEKALWAIAKCIDKVVSGETVYSTSEMEISEVIDFIENLSQNQFQKLVKFVEGVPVLEKEIKFSCRKCQHENTMTLRGLSNFF
jgi:hypothetical protein